MQADPSVQALLLRLAAIDTTTTQLTRRKANLPEHAELATLNAQRRGLADEVVALQTRIGDARKDLTRLDADMDVARTRLVRNQQRLDDGVVSEGKQIAGLQSEIDHLTGRISTLEDESLTAMQAIEDHEAAVADLTRQRADIETHMRALIAGRDGALAEADAELADLAGERATLAGQVPADVMAVYEKVAAKAGTGAASLSQGRCSGCGLLLDGQALRAALDAAPSEIVRCEECGRILVRA